ncbi:hypothetical protein [Micrococcus luteus]|uniref:hypothetical protein n=1 Tax=Micrococcus luteus TaxID=1270 RepID=UPI0015D89E54|nr:hypothetical protein [Micrococcus luteus]
MRRRPAPALPGRLGPVPRGEPGPVTETTPWDLEDDAVILHTFGTTVRPKGAQLTHRNIGCKYMAIVARGGPNR